MDWLALFSSNLISFCRVTGLELDLEDTEVNKTYLTLPGVRIYWWRHMYELLIAGCDEYYN